MNFPEWMTIRACHADASGYHMEVVIDWLHRDAVPSLIDYLRQTGQLDRIPVLQAWHAGYVAGLNAAQDQESEP